MARLPRLAAAGQAHLVLLCAPAGRAAFRDDEDRRRFLAALGEATRLQHVALHAWALLDDRIWLLATPPEAAALGRWVQAIGRRYVAAFNRRHGSTGALWEGRFRAAVVQDGEELRRATLAVDLAPVRAGRVGAAQDHPWSSARHHLGLAQDAATAVAAVHGAAYWALGNTPFEREAAYRAALDEGLTPAQWQRIEGAVRSGWALGDAVFAADLGSRLGRRAAPRPRGRPRLAKAPRQPGRVAAGRRRGCRR